MLPQLLLACQ